MLAFRDFLHFRHYDDVAAKPVEGSERAVINRRRMIHRLCIGLALASSVLALLAMSLGFCTIGVAGYIAAILPFAFFS
jgi:hypothetical protein